MPWWTIPLYLGSQLATKYLGGGKQTVTQEMSPEARQLYNLLMGQVGKGAPEYLTAPIRQRWASTRRGIREGIGGALGPGSGLEMANLMRATAGEGRQLGYAGQQYQDQLMSQLAGLVGGGTQTTRASMGWGDVAGNIGGDLLFWQGMQDALRRFGGGGGGGQGWVPGYESSPFRFGRQNPNSPFRFGG